jgi:prepilin-type N-terminal cleavage/methylation domain-containing protein
MARPNNSYLGFTLIEMIATVLIAGILAAITLPSLVKQRTLANAVQQVESGLTIVNLKARANSGNPYRMTLQVDSSTNEQYLKVEYALNTRCSAAATATWVTDPNQSIYIPNTVRIPNAATPAPVSPNIVTFPAQGLCFDSRGNVSSINGSPRIFSMIDSKPSLKAVQANISLTAIGDVSRKTYDSKGNEISGGQVN